MYRVLIVDDEMTVVRGLSQAVDWDDYNLEIILATTDATEAAAYITQKKVDLLITDVSMPEINGLELIKLAKKHQPMIRCVVISAYDRFDFVKQALALGAENYLLKPVDKTELHETLTKTVENMSNEEFGNMLDISNRMAFRSNILDRWVRNAIDEEELTERAQFLEIDIDSENWSVVVIQPYNTDAGFSHSLQLISYLQGSAQQQQKDLGMGAHYFINGSFQIIGILHDFSQDKPSREAFCDYMAALEIFASQRHISYFASVGPVVPSFLDVTRSYEQAARFIRAAWFAESPVFCADFDLAYEKEDKRKIQNWIEQGRTSDLISWLRRHYQLLLQQDQSLARLHAVNWAVVMLDALKDLTWQKAPEKITVLLTFFAQARPVQLQDWLCELARLLIEWHQDQQSMIHPYVRKMIDLIDENYEQDLSLKGMAERFMVSAAYLGQLFRSDTGQYFNEYLTAVRLEKALELIENTQRSVNDIAKSTGFSSQNYFNRLFKRAFGQSPGEYRMKKLM